MDSSIITVNLSNIIKIYTTTSAEIKSIRKLSWSLKITNEIKSNTKWGTYTSFINVNISDDLTK